MLGLSLLELLYFPSAFCQRFTRRECYITVARTHTRNTYGRGHHMHRRLRSDCATLNGDRDHPAAPPTPEERLRGALPSMRWS